MKDRRSLLREALSIFPSSFTIVLAMILVCSCGCGSTGSGMSNGLANALIPGRKEAEFRSRVEHDSFPNANEAMHPPAQATDK
jgi:hypothetical protein